MCYCCPKEARFAVMAWFIFVLLTISFMAGPGIWYYGLYKGWWFIPGIFGALILYSGTNFCIATFMDPGVYPRATSAEARFYEKGPSGAEAFKTVYIDEVPVVLKYCITCRFYRPPRTTHCSVCDACINTFDHHCPWINNCVGIRNYRYFYLFLISVNILLIGGTVMAILVVVFEGLEDNLLHPIVFISAFICVTSIGVLLPLLGLTGYHCNIVCRGTTTNEVITDRYSGRRNPFANITAANCCRILFGPQYPSMLHRHKTHPMHRWTVTRTDIKEMRDVQSPYVAALQGGGVAAPLARSAHWAQHQQQVQHQQQYPGSARLKQKQYPQGDSKRNMPGQDPVGGQGGNFFFAKKGDKNDSFSVCAAELSSDASGSSLV